MRFTVCAASNRSRKFASEASRSGSTDSVISLKRDKRNAGTVVAKALKERLDHFALADPDEIAIFPLVEPDANVRKALQCRTEPALRLSRACRHPAHAPHRPRKETNQPVSFAQRVTLQDDCFRLVNWHQPVGAPTTANPLSAPRSDNRLRRSHACRTKFCITAKLNTQIINEFLNAFPF